jgi:hypothetical protein
VLAATKTATATNRIGPTIGLLVADAAMLLRLRCSPDRVLRPHMPACRGRHRSPAEAGSCRTTGLL